MNRLLSKNMSYCLSLCLFFFMAFLLLVKPAYAAKQYKIAILRTTAPYAIEQEKGLKDSLKKMGFKEGVNIEYIPTVVVAGKVEDFAETASTIDGIIKQKPDIIAAIGTQASIPTWKIIEKSNIPMVFAGVTYPVDGGLIEAYNKPTGKNITGVGYAIPLQTRIKLIRDMFPDKTKFKKLAFIYSGQVLQDFSMVKNLKSLSNTYNFEFVFIDFFDYNKNSVSHKLLIQEIKAKNPDLIFGWFSMDQMSGDEKIVKELLTETKKPILAITTNFVDKGAIGGILTDHYDLGYVQAKMIAQILKGKKAGSIPPLEPTKYIIELNLKTANELKISFPKNILKSAKKQVK